MKTKLALLLVAAFLMAAACSGSGNAPQPKAMKSSLSEQMFPEQHFTNCTNFQQQEISWYQPSAPPLPGQSIWLFRNSQCTIAKLQWPSGDRAALTRATELTWWMYIAEAGGTPALAAGKLPLTLTPGEALDLAWLVNVMSLKEEEVPR
ncbi:MAG: hypothetical protein V1846_00785 [Candidatus Komeilibacteria bacterium]